MVRMTPALELEYL